MKPTMGHWRSSQAHQQYRAAYAAAMELLPTPTRTQDVGTRYGTVRTYTFCPPEPKGSPVVMCPGRSSGAAMWFKNLPDLARDREVVLFDALGDTGMSNQTEPLATTSDQADYVADMLNTLTDQPVHLVGHSFGGALAAAMAVHHPQQLLSLSLLEPVFVFGWPRLEVFALTLPASLPFMPQRWRDAALARIGGQTRTDMDDPLARMIAVGAHAYQAALPIPKPLTDDQLRSLQVPLLLAMADHSIMGGAQAAVDRAANLVPLSEATIWPGTTHSLPMEQAENIDHALNTFFRHHDAP